MRHPRVLCLILGLTVSLAFATSVCRSQAPPRRDDEGGGNRQETSNDDQSRIREYWNLEVGGPPFLLKAPAVRQELGLSTEQVRKLRTLESSIEGKRFEAFANARRPGGGDLDREMMASATRDLRRENGMKVAEILDTNQIRRLIEITTQVEGPRAVAWPEIQSKLRLIPPQVARIDDLNRRYLVAKREREMVRNELRSSLTRKGNTLKPEEVKAIEARLEKIDEDMNMIRQQSVRAMSRVLTRGQKDRFNKLIGKPFDMSKLLPPRDRPEEEKPAESRRPAKR